jgi:hypothetical protein
MGGARDGDLVRAVENTRQPGTVEGILRLRHVPSLDYVQVHVLGLDGGYFSVDPASVEVIRHGVGFVSDEDLADPLRGEPGWRRIIELDAAIAEGLVPPVQKRPDISQSEMDDRLDVAAAPLVAAGWTTSPHDFEESAQFGDCVLFEVARDGVTLLLEYYEDDCLVVWPLEPSGKADEDEPSELICAIDDPTAERCRAEFAAHGWLDPP